MVRLFNSSLKDYHGNPTWFFNGIARNTPFVTFSFLRVHFPHLKCFVVGKNMNHGDQDYANI